MVKRAAEWMAVMALLSVPIVGSISHARFTLDPSHTGYFLKLALDVREGKVLFRDAFDPYGALTVWLQAIGLIVFKNVQTLMWLTGLMVAGTGLLLYLIWRRLLPPAGAVAGLVIFVAHTRWPTIPWPNFYGTFFSTAAAWLLVRDLERPARRRLVLAGMMVGLAFLSRHEIGVFSLVALTIYLLFEADAGRPSPASATRRGIEAAALVYSGFLAVLGAFFIWLLAVGAMGDWYLQAVQMIRVYYEPLIAVESAFLPRIVQLLDVVFAKYQFLVLFSAGMTTALVIFGWTRGFETRDQRIAFLLAVTALFGAMQSYPIPNEFRYAIGLSPAYGLLVYAMLRPAAASGRAPTFVAVVVALIATHAELRTLGRDIWAHWDAARRTYPGYRRLNQPEILRGVWLPESQAHFYSAINDTISRYLTSHPGTAVLTTTGDPLPLTFIGHNQQFHPMFVVYPSVKFAGVRGLFNRPRTVPSGASMNYEQFVNDTANVILYRDFWEDFRRFVVDRKPVVINHGMPVPLSGYRLLLDITYPDDGQIDARFNYWWDQFGPTPRLVIWGYDPDRVSSQTAQ